MANQSELKSGCPGGSEQMPVNDSHIGKSCDHKCCGYLSEKLQENRIRPLDTQVMQNLYINDAMHIQLVAQMRQNQPVIPNSPSDILNNSFNNQGTVT